MKFGDLFYEEISLEESRAKGYYVEPANKRMLTCKRDIEMFIEDNMNTKLPLDGPQWRAWFLNYKDEVDDRTNIVMIFKLHHSVSDGISCTAMTGMLTPDFGAHQFVKFPTISFMQQMMLRITSPFYILLLAANIFTPRDENIFTRGKKNMTG
jgi:hypothetical protein